MMIAELNDQLNVNNISIRDSVEMDSLSILTAIGPHHLIFPKKNLEANERREAVAIQVARVALKLNGPKGHLIDETQRLQDEQAAIAWAAKRLVPDTVLTRALLEGWSTEHLAEKCLVTERFAAVRLAERREAPAPGRSSAPGTITWLRA